MALISWLGKPRTKGQRVVPGAHVPITECLDAHVHMPFTCKLRGHKDLVALELPDVRTRVAGGVFTDTFLD